MTRPGLSADTRVAIVGCGAMGEAILAGLLDGGMLPPSRVTVTSPEADRRDALAALFGVRAVADNRDAFPADVAVIAVKPQVIDQALAEVADVVGDALVVSIAVGVGSARIESHLPSGTSVVRVMPNTPALVGEGVSAIAAGSGASQADVDLVASLFAAVGETVVLDEKLIDVAAAVSGSGPAYFELMVDSLARAGVRHGLPRAVAERLAVATMGGTARLMRESDEHPRALMDRVTSPGGTTAAALAAADAWGFSAAVDAAVDAAVERAEELR